MKNNNQIGQGLSEFKPVELVGCEDKEAGSPRPFRGWVVHITYQGEPIVATSSIDNDFVTFQKEAPDCWGCCPWSLVEFLFNNRRNCGDSLLILLVNGYCEIFRAVTKPT